MDQQMKSESVSHDLITTKPRSGEPTKFTPRQLRFVTIGGANERKRSLRRIAKRCSDNFHDAVTMSKSRIYELRKIARLKPYHRINAPLITN